MAERYGPHINRETIYVDKYLSVSKGVLSGADGDKFIDPTPIFTSKGVTTSFTTDTVFVFNLVDNDNARRTVHHTCMDLSISSNYIVIDIGNEETYGQLYSTRYMKRRTSRPTSIFDIAMELSDRTIFDYIPSTISNVEEVKIYSCADADVDIEKQDQFLVANDTAATLGHNWLVSYLMSDKYNYPKEVRFISAPNIVTEVKQMSINLIPFALFLFGIYFAHNDRDIRKKSITEGMIGGLRFEHGSSDYRKIEDNFESFVAELIDDEEIHGFLTKLISG